MKKAEPNSEDWSGYPDGLQRAHSQVIFTVKNLFLFSLWQKPRWNAVFGRFCGLYRPELDELSLNCRPQPQGGREQLASRTVSSSLSEPEVQKHWHPVEADSPPPNHDFVWFFLDCSKSSIIQYYRTLTIINKHMKIQTNEEKWHLRTYYISKDIAEVINLVI